MKNLEISNKELKKATDNFYCTDFALITASATYLQALKDGKYSFLKKCCIPHSKSKKKFKAPSLLVDEDLSILLEEAYKKLINDETSSMCKTGITYMMNSNENYQVFYFLDEYMYNKEKYVRLININKKYIPIWFKVCEFELVQDEYTKRYIGPIISFSNLVVYNNSDLKYHDIDLYSSDTSIIKPTQGLTPISKVKSILTKYNNIETQIREKNTIEKYEEFLTLITKLQNAINSIGNSSLNIEENFFHKIKIKPEVLFVEIDNHLQINPIFRSNSALKYFDLHNFSFDNVAVSGIDFRKLNVYLIEPQKVYNRDLSNCKFSDNNGFGAFTDFSGVNLCGTDLSECSEFTNLSGAITDENTILPGISKDYKKVMKY